MDILLIGGLWLGASACTLAWMTADRRPERIVVTALVGGFPHADGSRYANAFEITGDVMPFPGWEAFDAEVVADLDAEARRAFTAAAVEVPATVARGVVHIDSGHWPMLTRPAELAEILADAADRAVFSRR